MSYLSDAKLADLEKEFMPVDSELFKNVVYAVDRRGRGMLVYISGKPVPLDAEDVLPFAAEIRAVWNNTKPRTVR